MYEDGIVSHIGALHTSVQPSVRYTNTGPSLGQVAGEDSVLMIHTLISSLV